MKPTLRSVTFNMLKIVLLSMAIVVCTNVHAQLNSENLTQLTEKDGLPGALVQSVLIDKLGYVWVGTNNGLTRYDGYEFKRFYFNPNDTATVHGLVVMSMLEDRAGKIWVATSPSWLNVYDPATKAFSQYNYTSLVNKSPGVEINISSMCQDKNGRIYFGVDTYYGDIISPPLLYKDEKSNSLKKFPIPDSLNIQNVYTIRKDNRGNIWLLSRSGIFNIDTNGKLSRFRLFDTGFSGFKDFPGDLQIDKEGHLWIITFGSKLYDVDLAKNTYKTWLLDTRFISREYDNMPNRIILDKDENIWVGTNAGVQFFDRKKAKFSIFKNGVKQDLERTPVRDLVLDSFGTLWIGSHTGGVIKIENKPQLKSYSNNKADKNSLTSGWANIIYESSDGKIWISTGGSNIYSGINILDPRTGSLQPVRFPEFTNRTTGISAIWEKAPGEMYMATYRGISVFSEKTRRITATQLPGVPDTATVFFHYTDTRKNEWICSIRGLYKKAKGAQVFENINLSLVKGSNATSNETTRVYESKKHGLWILTNNGLFLYNYTTGKIEKHGYDKSLGDIFVTQDVNSFYEDQHGITWVGTWDGGLSKYNVETKKIKTYTRNDGLPSMSIQSIMADEKNNNLWLSTFDGLSRFNFTTDQFTNFSIADGIQSQLFADGSFLKTSAGLFAFGGSNGITIFNPDELNKTSIPPKVFLTDLKLFNKSVIPGNQSILEKPINETEQIILAYNQNNISIDFIALHYSNPSKNRYSYKLENYDNEWRDIGNLHTAFYPNLPPGNYTFRVKAANDKGVWNEQGATLKITVNPPWWKTTLAYVIYGLLIIGFVFGVDRFLRRRLRQQEKARNQARELEQAREIEKAYHKLEESHETLKSTQSQLIQSEKMASLGELTAGIAHEIQNPLNFVNNFSEVNTELIDELSQEVDKGNLDEVKALAKDIKENEQKINHHGKRADAIVKGMLQHSRSSNGVKEPTDINALCDEYLRLSYHGLRAKDKSFNATMKTDFDNSIGNINIIPQDIGRVILNLINNAFYAVDEKKKKKAPQPPEGGVSYDPTVTVTTRKLSSPLGAGGPSGGPSGLLQISVTDNGSGIPPSVLDKIFQPFFTTKPTGQATGLGLSLSYDIVKAHGGELKVETPSVPERAGLSPEAAAQAGKEGEGTTFIIQLPTS